MLIHELTLNQNAGSNDDGLQVESGENWLRLLLKEGSSVLDHTQGTQNNKDSQDKSKSIYPSIVSLSNTGGSFNAPSDECYICIDLDGNFLAIKDMRSPVHTTVSTESQLGILRKNSDNWEILPRRQLRILNTGDKICTSVVDGKPDFPDGQVLKYKSREKTNAISNLDIGSPQALLTQPLEEDHDEIDDDDDDKTVKFEASQAPSKPTSIELITQPEEDNCSDDGGVDEERDDSKRDALKMIMEEKENELPASEVVGGSSKNEIPVYIDTSKENGLKKNGEIESMNLMTQPLREDSSDEETDYDDSEIAKDHDNLSSRRDEIMKAANVVPPKDASDILDTNQVIEEKEEEDGVDRSRGVFSPSMVLFSEDYLGAGEGQKSQGHKTKESLFDSSTQNSPSLLTPVKPVSKDTNVQVETLLTSPKTEYKKLDDEARGSSGLEINPVKDTEDRPKCIALLSPVEGANHKTDDNINGNDGNDSENLLNDSDEEEEDQKKCSEDESYKDLSNVNKKNETIQSHAEDSTTITDQMKANGGEKRDGNKSNSDRKKSQFEVSPEKTNHEDAVDFGNTAPEDEVEEWSETQGINANDCRQTRKTPEKSSENGEVLDQKQRKREQEDDEFAFRDESGQEKVANQGRTAHGAKSTRKRARQSLPAKSNRPNPPLETPTRKKPRQTPATKHLIEEDTPSSTTAPLVGRASRKRTRQNPAMVPSARNNEPVVRVITTGVELSASEKNMIKRIGGVLLYKTEDAMTATHVIASSNGSSIRRTPKLMIGLSKTNNIVALDWLVQSSKQRKVLSSKNFQLVDDKKAEKQYNFNMHTSLQRAGILRSNGRALLEGYSIFCCAGVAGNKKEGNMTPPSKEFRLILESAGGTWLTSLPSKKDFSGTVIIVSKLQNEAKKQVLTKKVAVALEKGAVSKTTEEIFHSIMLQEFNI